VHRAPHTFYTGATDAFERRERLMHAWHVSQALRENHASSMAIDAPCPDD
jgi:hypothetical protein